MDLNLIENAIIGSYEKIDFVRKYKKISVDHDDFDDAMSRMNKSENLKVLRSFGYPFKISNPGQFYIFEEGISNLKLKFVCQLSKGLIITYTYIYINNELIKRNRFAKIYRLLVNDENAVITTPKFKDYEELWEVMSSLLLIYEEFKEAFLRSVKELEL